MFVYGGFYLQLQLHMKHAKARITICMYALHLGYVHLCFAT